MIKNILYCLSQKKNFGSSLSELSLFKNYVISQELLVMHNNRKIFNFFIPTFLFSTFALSINLFAAENTPPARMIDLPPLPTISEQITSQNLPSNLPNEVFTTDANIPLTGHDKVLGKQYKNINPWRGPDASPEEPYFQELLKNQFPMSPAQIKTFRDTVDTYEKAIQNKSRNPSPVMSTRSVNLSPGSIPPPVRIATGYVSSILFIDETGAPWPIKAYDIGNSQAFDVVWDKVSNLLLIQGLRAYENTNIVVLLHNLETPVILNLINDQQKVDYRLDLRVPGMGPKANTPIITNTNIPEGDDILMGLLDGIPPEVARPLEVKGAKASAWMLNDDELLIRTRLTILSPAYTNSMRSPDGMKVYRLPRTPLIMAAKDGSTYQLTITGY